MTTAISSMPSFTAVAETQYFARLVEPVLSPVASGDVIGRAVYKLGDRELGTVDILCSEDIAAAVYKDYFMESLQMYLP